MRKFISVVLFVAMAMIAILPAPALAEDPRGGGGVEVEHENHHDISAPLRDLRATPTSPSNLPDLPNLARTGPNLVDTVLQTRASVQIATTAGLNFAGVGNGDYGFAVTSAPPDTEGVVGDTQYVQWVNTSFAIFNKATGALVFGPAAGNTLWSGFGGGCQTNNDGDPIVQYDKAAKRWIFTQFSVTTTPYLQCVAVSTTSDATGTYSRYAFTQPNFNDYPKLGVWPDGYYTSYNMFSGNTFVGGRACAFDRAAMLAGNTATQICFQLGTTYGGMLPSDLDGSTPPPAGAPNTFVALDNNNAALDIWQFHADFATPANSTFGSGANHTPSLLAVPGFTPACGGGGTCIPQSSTTQQLDSLADRLMYRLAYRNFGDHEALVVNHSVTAGTSVGIRWYELRGISTTPVLYQSGTYAPDASYRWMGSIALDKAGDIALAYSVSSSSLHPGIRYTGRAPSDPLGTLQAENTVAISNNGSQTGNLSRWGDYSALTVDPTNDCTFFYTNEYLKTSGSFNWSTQISSFQFPNCNTAPPVLTSILVAPASATVQTNATQQFTATGLDQFGQPVSPQPAFTWAVSGGGTINATGLFTAGAAAGGPFTVTATSASLSGSASVTVTVPVPNDFSIGASPSTLSIVQGNNGTSTISTAVTSGSAGTVSLSASVSPAGPTVSLSPAAVTAGGSATLTVSVGASVAAGSYAVTVTGVEGSATHSVSLTVTVTAPAPNDFSISASPSTLSIVQGNNATSTISTAVTSGSAGTVSLSASVSPAGPTATLSSSSLTAGSSATLTISVGASVALGSYAVTVTGVEGSSTHSATVSVNVTAPSASAIINGGFETGSLANWTTSAGTASVVNSGAHGGTYAARLGATTPTSGNSSIVQTFIAPAGSPKLTFWYNVTCPDTVTYDWATATLRDNTSRSTRTVLTRTCTLGAGWKQVVATLTAGHSYTLTLTNRDDNYPGDATFTLFDDVTAQ